MGKIKDRRMKKSREGNVRLIPAGMTQDLPPGDTFC